LETAETADERFIKLGFRLGRSIRNITETLTSAATSRDGKIVGEQTKAAESVAAAIESITVDSRVANHRKEEAEVIPIPIATLVDLASELPLDLKADTEQDAALDLISMTIEEQRNNYEGDVPDHSKIWAFAQDKPSPTKQFFSLNRWPLPLQDHERQEFIVKNAPLLREEKPKETPSTEIKALLDDEEFWKRQGLDFIVEPRERKIDGPTMFPFGETPFQACVKSAEIARDLANGKCDQAARFIQ
jgi:hypothetical protein